MLIGEPQRSGADVHFVLMGIPVRVHPFFWLMAVILGLNLTAGDAILILLWVLAVFLSIMVHEFGHALAFRYYGISSSVVLYHLGGMAIPGGAHGSFGSHGYGVSMRSKQQIVISASGPVAQLLLAAVVVLLVRVAGHQVPGANLPYVRDWLVGSGTPIPNLYVRGFVLYLLLPSIFWALMNLTPVYPLDGGQIAREVCLLNNARDGIRHSLILSIAAGVAVAAWAFSAGQIFLVLLFGVLAYSNYQTLQGYMHRGGRPW